MSGGKVQIVNSGSSVEDLVGWGSATLYEGTAAAPALTSTTAAPRTITPNGDGQTDSSQVSYTLSAPAIVTATLRGPDGADLAVLFSQQRQPGKQSFRFDLQPIELPHDDAVILGRKILIGKIDVGFDGCEHRQEPLD